MMTNAMRRGALVGLLCLSMGEGRVLAQDEVPSEPEAEVVEAPAEETEVERTEVEAPAREDEFGDDAEARAVHERASVRDALDAPRSTDRDYYVPREEVESAPSHRNEPLGGAAEVFVGVLPNLALEGLGGPTGLEGGVSGGTDFVFAVDRRIWIGLGLSIVHSEAFVASSSFTRVTVPLITQVYFDDPQRGEATPTLRITPSFRWGQGSGSSGLGNARMGGGLEVGAGVTWFVTDFLAIRVLGTVGAEVAVLYDGYDAISFSAGVGANVGVVIRL